MYALLEEKQIIEALARTEVGNIWGIGRRWQEKLKWLGITNALELSKIDQHALGQFNVVMQKLVL